MLEWSDYLIVIITILVMGVLSASAQPSWCSGNCFGGGPPTPQMQRKAKENADRRARFEKKWGSNTNNYNDQTLGRIEKNPSDPDCWQYTPVHCY